MFNEVKALIIHSYVAFQVVYEQSSRIFLPYLIHPTRENPGLRAVLFLILPVAEPDALDTLRFELIFEDVNN